MNAKKTAIVTVGVLAAVYAAGCVYFGGHLFPNTTVDGEDASFMREEEVRDLIVQKAAEGTFTVRVKDQTYVLNRADAVSVTDPDQTARTVLRQAVPAWPVECFRTHTLSSGQALTFERDKAAEILESQGLFSYSADPVDARIGDYEEGKGYAVIPDEKGWRADREQLLDVIGEAVTAEETEIDLTDTFAVPASVTADDAELNRICSEKNALVNHTFTLKIGDVEQTLGGSELNSWLTTSRDGKFGFDTAKFYAYADQLQNSFAGKLASLSDAEGDGSQYLVDAGLFERILAAKLHVTLPKGETAAEKKQRESANSAILKKAKRAAAKAKTEEEKAQILAEAEAAQTPEPEMIALPYVTAELETADSAAEQAGSSSAEQATGSSAEQAESVSTGQTTGSSVEQETADPAAAQAAAEELSQKIAAQEAEQQEMSQAVLLDGVYIVNLETPESAESRKEKASKQVAPATRSNALIPDDPADEIPVNTAEQQRAAAAETVTLSEDEIYVPVIDADPGFQYGFGLDYIDISIENQHVVLYENARLVMESDCVTGLPTKERETHKGVFHINYKQRNRILTGQQKLYASFVNYWMPFDGGIGLHDATWRGKFGGKIYTYSGSHGCVNLPLSFAKKLYKRVYTGETVYVH